MAEDAKKTDPEESPGNAVAARADSNDTTIFKKRANFWEGRDWAGSHISAPEYTDWRNDPRFWISDIEWKKYWDESQGAGQFVYAIDNGVYENHKVRGGGDGAQRGYGRHRLWLRLCLYHVSLQFLQVDNWNIRSSENIRLPRYSMRADTASKLPPTTLMVQQSPPKSWATLKAWHFQPPSSWSTWGPRSD